MTRNKGQGAERRASLSPRLLILVTSHLSLLLFTTRSSPCLVLLPVGFALPVLSPELRCALTAPFHPYRVAPLRRQRGGLFSVALSRPLRVVGVTHHRVLWSPDFPPCRLPRTAIAQPTPNVEGDHTKAVSYQLSAFSGQPERTTDCRSRRGAFVLPQHSEFFTSLWGRSVEAINGSVPGQRPASSLLG